jgi:hypothetical protein
MKKIVVAAVLGLLCIPSGALANERVGDAALGALSGAVVLGPIGAAAGAVIGFTAGPSIAGSWGVRGSDPRRSAKLRPRSRNRVSSKQANPPADLRPDAAAHVQATQEPSTQPTPKEISTPAATPKAESDDAKIPINGLEM